MSSICAGTRNITMKLTNISFKIKIFTVIQTCRFVFSILDFTVWDLSVWALQSFKTHISLKINYFILFAFKVISTTGKQIDLIIKMNEDLYSGRNVSRTKRGERTKSELIVPLIKRKVISVSGWIINLFEVTAPLAWKQSWNVI